MLYSVILLYCDSCKVWSRTARPSFDSNFTDGAHRCQMCGRRPRSRFTTQTSTVSAITSTRAFANLQRGVTRHKMERYMATGRMKFGDTLFEAPDGKNRLQSLFTFLRRQ